MLASVVEACQFEYKDLQDSWRLLETKGQALTSVSGVFIAGAFAFARDLAAGAASGTKFFLILAVGMLLLTTVYGVATLFVRAVKSPMGADGASKLVDDLLRISTPEDLPVRYCNFLRDQTRAWESALASFRSANHTKARFLIAGQITLLVASAVVSGLVILAIWSK